MARSSPLGSDMHVVNLAFFDAFITIFGWPTKAHSAFVAGFERIVF